MILNIRIIDHQYIDNQNENLTSTLNMANTLNGNILGTPRSCGKAGKETAGSTGGEAAMTSAM